ncbi:MAG: 16S rRNA (adenine(1518)-N(6)/adenine(1519)-N(6))-dimethyltransferase RsmA [Proteobacteria bacterium]|nr:16S rRNA (adenine(1518)-N(6)/adenine(1519)-N(6))-dimethyltransferase RsmA [Pseudomonadota bacterium]
MSVEEKVRALPALRAIIEAHNLSADKRLGQHFIHDLNLTGRVARAAGDLSTCTVMEVGPGPGALTRALLLSGTKDLVAVEYDARCVGALYSLVDAAGGSFKLIHGDALNFDESTIVGAGKKLKIVANLPYNVGTVLLFKWLESAAPIESMTLMFQKEVVDRMIAEPGSKAYGRLAVMAQWRCKVAHNFDIPPQAFVPPPKVNSSVVTLYPLPNKDMKLYKDLEIVCRTLFNQRRKKISTSLKQITSDGARILEAAGINPDSRPEIIPVDAFERLVRVLHPSRYAA